MYRLIPYPVAKPWGGGHLDGLVHNTARQKIGELVLFSNLPQFPVKVIRKGSAVLLADFWKEQFGEVETPFMIKILSTAEPISVQNHPSDEDAQALGLLGGGKLEAWTILDADPQARMYLGLKSEYSGEILRRLNELENPLAVFHERRPQRGDVVLLRPGLVHSTSGKLLFYEIQQLSDHTFRIYDFGRGRALHIDQAIFCLHEQTPQVSNFSTDLVTTRFRVSYHSAATGVIALRSESGAVLTWLGAAVELQCGEHKMNAHWGDSFYLPETAKKNIMVKRSSGATHNLPMIDMLFEAHL